MEESYNGTVFYMVLFGRGVDMSHTCNGTILVSVMVLFGRCVDMSHTCNGTILVAVIVLFGRCVDTSLVTRPLHILLPISIIG